MNSKYSAAYLAIPAVGCLLVAWWILSAKSDAPVIATSPDSKSAVSSSESEQPRQQAELSAKFNPTQTQPLSPAEYRALIDAVTQGDEVRIQVDRRVGPEFVTEVASIKGSLFDLLLDGGGPDDQAMAELGRISTLEHLRVRLSPISDAGIELLIGDNPPPLRVLNLPHAAITHEGITQLQRLPALEQLRLGGDQLDDRAAAAIAKLPKLRSLHLIGPSLTGAGLDALSQAPKLGSLYLDDCPLPDDAWQRLFTAKPNMHVHVDQRHHDRDPNQHSH